MKFLTLSLVAVYMFFGQSAIADQDDLEARKQFVIDFYTDVILFRDGNAIDNYIGDTYIQHNPNLGDGKEELRDFVGLNRRDEPTGEIVRVIAEGDLVVLHVRDFSGLAIMDIFRVAGCEIVEHWDVIQSIPEMSRNDNTMF
ncbi:hypothetical protein MLD52_00700 [Puniceicoccaceae bacterium K14]|nr:hypothetical protein [Puniceicoccaceae bacterium K14]